MTERSLDWWQRGLASVGGLYPDASEDGRREVASFTPIVQASARGARFQDVEGREWIDYHMGWGSALLGHADEGVARAIAAQLQRGFAPSVAPALDIEVAERLQRLIPGAERVVFGKNGSDACTTAVRLARLATGREMVLAAAGHYHGFHDWTVARDIAGRGVPKDFADAIRLFPYNDLDAFERLLRKHRRHVAAVILEPMRDLEPAPGYLAALAERTRQAGALLIFDEMLTGFRLAPGGAQEHFGVRADLCCLGKSLANGLPLACVTGAEPLLRRIHEVRASMTFQHEQLSLAAAAEVLDRVATGEVVSRVKAAGLALREGLEAAARRHPGCPMQIHGFPGRQSLSFPSRYPDESRARLTLFIQEMLVRGVFTVGNLLPSASHGDAEIRQTLHAAEEALGVVADAAARSETARRIRFPFPIV